MNEIEIQMILYFFGIFAAFVVANSNLSRLFPIVKLFLVQKIFRYWESAARIILPNITRYYQVCMNETIQFSKRLKRSSDIGPNLVVGTNTQSKSCHFQYQRHLIFGDFPELLFSFNISDYYDIISEYFFIFGCLKFNMTVEVGLVRAMTGVRQTFNSKLNWGKTTANHISHTNVISTKIILSLKWQTKKKLWKIWRKWTSWIASETKITRKYLSVSISYLIILQVSLPDDTPCMLLMIDQW